MVLVVILYEQWLQMPLLDFWVVRQVILGVDALSVLGFRLEGHNYIVEGVTFQDQVGDDCIKDGVKQGVTARQRDCGCNLRVCSCYQRGYFMAYPSS